MNHEMNKNLRIRMKFYNERECILTAVKWNRILRLG